MLVSAVNANLFQSKKIAENNVINNESAPVDKSNETTFNSAQNNPSRDNLDLYNSIIEWKHFCHKQILKGKLDVIA